MVGSIQYAPRRSCWGATVEVWLTADPSRLSEVTGRHLDVLHKLGIHWQLPDADAALPPADLIVDALVGYSLRGAPTGSAATMVQAANRHTAPVLSLDIPTGVDATSGEVHKPAIRATATLTLALPKTGLREPTARAQVGELYLGDIGVPPSLYALPSLHLNVDPPFARSDLVRIW